jgi:hypothetical protein
LSGISVRSAGESLESLLVERAGSLDVTFVAVVFEAHFEVFEHLAALRVGDVEHGRSERGLHNVAKSGIAAHGLHVVISLLGVRWSIERGRLDVEAEDVGVSVLTNRKNQTALEGVAGNHLRMREVCKWVRS